MEDQSRLTSTKQRTVSTRFQVEEVPESSRGNGHSMVRLDDRSMSVEDGMTQVELRSRTNSFVDPAAVDISHPIKVLKAPREIKLKIAVVFLFILIVIGTTCVLLFYSEPPLHYKVGRLTFYVDDKTVRVSYRGSNYTHSRVGLNLPGVTPSTCAATSDRRLCLEWKEYGQLEIDWLELENMDCYDFQWTAIHKDVIHKDCLSLLNAHWYGGATSANQHWPLEVPDLSSQPYLSGDGDAPFGPIAERYWLSSNGLGVQVNDSSFISVSMDSEEQEICLESGHSDFTLRMDNTSGNAALRYTMCLAADLAAVHSNMSNRFVSRTRSLPDSYIITNPTWAMATPSGETWNASFLLDTATMLNGLGYSVGMFEIPASYAAHEGDLVFDSSRFKDVSNTIATVEGYGFRTAVQVSPYISTASRNFIVGEANGFWIKDPRNIVPGLTRWGSTIGAVLDMSKSEAVQWFTSKLQDIKDMGVDALMFDYGEASYLPLGFQTEQVLENPDEYATLYATIANEVTSPFIRCVYRSQHIPLIVELVAKDPTWDGLKTIIPTALTMGLQGYPYFMPDLKLMPEGCSRPQDCLPDKDLLIRYVELSAFLPAMQIPTVLPYFDQQTRTIIKKWVDFHRNETAQLVLDLAGAFSERGVPVVRPLWWGAPTDLTSLRVDSEFLVGDDLLVAPVLEQGAIQRDVYLPPGTWQTASGSQQFEGGQWLTDVSVPLENVAYYRRVQ